MQKSTIILMGLVILVSVWMLRPQTGLAQANTFAGVVPFSTSAGTFGFFDQNSGKLYMYDNNLTKCIFIGQVENLGEPINPALPETPEKP